MPLAIFDHDGVLVDSLEFHQRAWLELGARAGLPFTEEFIRATFGMTNPSIFRSLLGNDLDPGEIAHLGDLKEQCYRDVARDQLVLMPGVRETLDALSRRGWLLAIGSSGPRANLELTIERCGLEGRFASIVGLEDITHGKPDPEVFLRAAERAGEPASASVVFEDAIVGIQAALAAGMQAIGVGTTNPIDVLIEAGAHMAVQGLDQFDVERFIGDLR